tara:strand:+ start:45 stop:266 length:222 start_codon:yes stop_codon:yes gene_type:complete
MTPFKPIKTLGSVLAVFLCLSMLTDLVSIVSTLAQHALLERMLIGDYTMARPSRTTYARTSSARSPSSSSSGP